MFPSQLWDAPPPTPVRRPDRVVIGWGGSRAHREDLRAVIPALAGVLERHPEVELAVMTDAELRPAFDGLPAERVSFTPWGALASYYRFLEGIDIGIAPLAPTAFNRCLGDTRFMEYAAHGVLAVCADLEPYRDVVRPGETGYLFADAAELETVLERALSRGRGARRDPGARRALRRERAHRAPPRRATASGSTCRSPRRSGSRSRGASARSFPRPRSATNATRP